VIEAPPSLNALVSASSSTNKTTQSQQSIPPTTLQQQYESVTKENQQLQKEAKDLNVMLLKALQERLRLKKKNEVLLKFLRNVQQEVDQLQKIEKYKSNIIIFPLKFL
jgi:anion-transporting  ArsA/GET3 family ATPase